MTRRGAAWLIGLMLAGVASMAARAADLPFFGDGEPPPVRLAPPPGFAAPPPQPGLITNPFRGQYFIEPRRFDAYGYPVRGPIVTEAPDPFHAATGCPQMLQPVYDGAGNFAGYSPVQACR